ncbi:MAG: TorD/DmsD family molecular chaperone [Anaerovoracaceae bacterium]|jgi:hypothetical protein
MANERTDTRAAHIRGSIYAFLTEAFIRLPDEGFIGNMKSPGTLEFLTNIKNLKNDKIKSGIMLIEGYINLFEGEDKETYLESMAVDRTSLIRPVQKGTLKAPYEGLYNKKENANKIILNVKKFYKKVGILPYSRAKDSEDFFCTQLDFMRQLCIMEAKDLREDIKDLQKEFLHTHLGSWIGEYCREAIPLAKTDFYKGLLMFLDGFIELEKQFAGEI